MFFSRLTIFLLATLSFIASGSIFASHSSHHKIHKKSHVKQVLTKINLNTADAKLISTLKGIGSKKAETIVAYRKQHGRFKSLNNLVTIKGIGKKFLTRLQRQNPGRIYVN